MLRHPTLFLNLPLRRGLRDAAGRGKRAVRGTLIVGESLEVRMIRFSIEADL